MFVGSSTRHPAAELEVVLLLHDKHALRHAVAEALGTVLNKFDIAIVHLAHLRIYLDTEWAFKHSD